jgi:hypothetical protein
VVVVVLVGDDQHAAVAAAPLHVLPRRAVFLAAAPVVPPARTIEIIECSSPLSFRLHNCILIK